MENRNDEFPIKPILILIVVYFGYCIVQEIIRFIHHLLSGLLIIMLVATSIFVAYWLYRFITDKQYGVEKKTREIARLEQRRKDVISRLPKHIREEADEYFKEKQRAVFTRKSSSRLDDVLDRTKQVISTFRGGRNGNKDSHR